MATGKLVNFRLVRRFNNFRTQNNVHKLLYCTDKTAKPEGEPKVFGFAEALSKHVEEVKSSEEPVEVNNQESFAYLLRHSKFIGLGRPEGKEVVGTIYRVVGDDLYIDFGWKFHTVCERPRKNGKFYVRGTQVKLLIKDLELSKRFLGSTTDITLMEADCVLLGILKTPVTKNE